MARTSARTKSFAILSLTLELLASAGSRAQDLSTLRFDLAATGLAAPVALAHAGDARLFVVLKEGRIVIFEGGRIREPPFLDLRDRVRSNGFEQGLLGLAFHPRFRENGRFFVHFTRQDGAVVIARYAVSADPSVAEPASEAVLLEIAQPAPTHNGGQLAFGPDGHLYVGLGDGGGDNDPRCQAQDLRSLLGKILRLDVDSGSEAPPFYVPAAGNPFVGSADWRAEIWAYGLRNPWRFSFDRATGDLYIGDVGQELREEVNLQPASSPGGENYGWKVMEGDLCTDDTDGCRVPVPPCGAPELSDPLLAYNHATGCAVIGGHVYRGSEIPDLGGFYVFGDFCTGMLAAVRQGERGRDLRALQPTLPQLRSFGEDAAGELWAVAGSRLYRLVDRGALGCRPGSTTLCLNGGRFEVTAAWRTAERAGVAAAAELSGDAGYFWFFDESNPELFVKLLDGCSTPLAAFWVFAAGLTDVEVELRVRDTQSGEVNTYLNPLGRPFELLRDTAAFATCPGRSGGRSP